MSSRLRPLASNPGPVPVPDPALTVVGLASRILPSPDQGRYGTATDDPLGRNAYPKGKRFGIPLKAEK